MLKNEVEVHTLTVNGFQYNKGLMKNRKISKAKR